MAVHIDEVEVQVDEDARAPRRADAAADPRSGAPDPALRIEIDHVIAVLRSRSMRLRAD